MALMVAVTFAHQIHISEAVYCIIKCIIIWSDTETDLGFTAFGKYVRKLPEWIAMLQQGFHTACFRQTAQCPATCKFM